MNPKPGNNAGQARVEAITGGRRSERAARIDERLRASLGHAVLLVPTRARARLRTEELLLAPAKSATSARGVWGEPVQTFQDFVDGLLAAERLPIVPLTALERRLLLEGVVESLAGERALDMLGDAALSDGFINQLDGFITALKQAAVTPEAFEDAVRRKRAPSPLDAVVGQVYTRYQAELHKRKAYDQTGLYWEAAIICGASRPTAMAGLRVLLLDEFDDFTPAQFRLLKGLAVHLDTLVFGLAFPAERPSARDLFAVPIRTLEQIQHHFPEGAVETCPESPPKSCTDFTASELFWRDPPPGHGDLTPNLQIVPCSRPMQEAETIARRVKDLLLDGETPADRIAIVYPNIEPVAARLRAVLAEFGIPYHMLGGISAAASGPGRFLLQFLDVLEGWRRDDVCDILTSPWFAPPASPEDALARDAVPVLAKAAQTVRGREEWSNRLERVARLWSRNPASGAAAPSGPDAETVAGEGATAEPVWAVNLPRGLREKGPEWAAHALTLFSRLVDAAARIPAEASASSFAVALLEFLEERPWDAALDTLPEDIRADEAEALQTLYRVLTGFRDWRPERAVVEKRAKFAARLRRALTDAPVTSASSGAGVVCTGMDRIRHQRLDYVFFAGVNEGNVPRRLPVSALYSEADLAAFRDAGAPLQSRTHQISHEMLRFQQVLDAAGKELVITYCSLSSDGKELLPSPYLVDLRRLLGMHGLLREAPLETRRLPSPEQVASWRDLRNAAMAGSGELARAFEPELRPLTRLAAIEFERQGPAPFSRFDGVLDAKPLLNNLLDLFGPARHYSVNQLETYAACPFRFFAERVLRIEEPETPLEEFDPRIRGAVLHRVLQRFHEIHEGLSITEIIDQFGMDHALESIVCLVEEAFRDMAWLSPAASPAVTRLEQRRAAMQLERYLNHQAEREEKDRIRWNPRYFEVSFGRTPQKSASPLSRPEPFSLDTAAGPILLSGVIDRIDLADSELVARIIDYKTGAPPQPKEIARNLSLQLALYVLAVERHLRPGTACEEAWFVAVGRKTRTDGLKPNQGEPKDVDRRQKAAEAAGDIVLRIRSGAFPPAPAERACQGCAVRRACRFEAPRVMRKAADDAPAASPESGP